MHVPTAAAESVQLLVLLAWLLFWKSLAEARLWRAMKLFHAELGIRTGGGASALIVGVLHAAFRPPGAAGGGISFDFWPICVDPRIHQ